MTQHMMIATVVAVSSNGSHRSVHKKDVMERDLSRLQQQVFRQRLINVIGLLCESEVLWVLEGSVGHQGPCSVTPGDHPQTCFRKMAAAQSDWGAHGNSCAIARALRLRWHAYIRSQPWRRQWQALCAHLLCQFAATHRYRHSSAWCACSFCSLTHRPCSWRVVAWPSTARLGACADESGMHQPVMVASRWTRAQAERAADGLTTRRLAYHGTRRPVSGGLAKKDEFHRAMSGPMHCDTMLRMSGSRQYSRNARS